LGGLGSGVRRAGLIPAATLAAALEGRRLYTTASVGVAVAHARYERAEDLLRDAGPLQVPA
jgi:hypothetical protein